MNRIKILISAFIFLAGLSRADTALAEPLQRYISLAPSTTEILFALGLNQEIVGVSSYCDYPEQAAGKERVGDFSSPNIEKIISLRPDYIFCTGLEQAPVIEQLKKLKLKVYVSHPRTIQELFSSINEIGIIVNKEYTAQLLIREMTEKLNILEERSLTLTKNKKPKVFIEIWHNPISTAGQNSFVGQLIELAGGENIASDTQRDYSIFSAEEVIRRDPDVIIIAYMGQNITGMTLKKRFGWEDINAVKNNHVYNDIDPNILLRPSPRSIEGIEQIQEKLFISYEAAS
ncbi:MAG: cobalamin-binding protein [Candidatus Omnitrophica bacterium]|nr:cobalamin-binding protein [Candidatus Omnitrophota bacterium]